MTISIINPLSRGILSSMCLLSIILTTSNAFQNPITIQRHQAFTNQLSTLSSSSSNSNDEIVTSRFPTSPEDQVRQASISILNANKDGIDKKRHAIRLLLPIIGATELDDWPGGARQMMEAASPLIQDVLRLVDNGSANSDDSDNGNDSNSNADAFNIQESVIDEDDGVRALFTQGQSPKDDACAILLPSADTVKTIKSLNDQVGNERNLLLVNTQWRRQSDFNNNNIVSSGLSSIFGGGNTKKEKNDNIEFIEMFEPTFHCSNVMVEGDIIRILRTYPSPWRVYLRVVNNEDEQDIDWIEIGTKDVLEYSAQNKKEWEMKNEEVDGTDYDGGKIFDYGIPSYKEIETMIVSREGYVPKSLSERAASAFTFIKDTL